MVFVKYIHTIYSSVLCFVMCNQGGDGDEMKVVDLLECYQQSEQHRTVQKQLNPLLDSLVGREQAGGTIRNKKKAITYATNFLWQVISCTVCVAVPGRNQTLFCCVFQSHYHIQSALEQNFH